MKVIAFHFTLISIIFHVYTGFATQVIKENVYYWNNSNQVWNYTSSLYHYPNQLGKDTLQLEWDTTQNSFFHRYRFQYNSQGLETSWSHETSSNTNPVWVTSNLRLTVYDVQNNPYSIKKYANIFNTQLLTDSNGFIYTYDAAHNNRIIEKITSSYHPQIGPFFPTTKDSFVYGSNNEIIEQYASTFNATTSTWDKTSRFSNYNYLNTTYDKPQSYETYNFDSVSTWKLNGRKLFQYLDNNGLIVSTQIWYDWLMNYEQYNQITNSYDSCSHANLYKYEHWNSTLNDWVIDVSSKHLNTYSSDSCRLAEHIEQKWDNNSLQYKNYLRNEFVDYSAFIGIKEEEFNIDFSASPNPAFDNIELRYTLYKEGQVSISLCTIQGDEIYRSKSIFQSADTYKHRIDLKGISPGIYLLAIDVNGFKKIRKIVVQAQN